MSYKIKIMVSGLQKENIVEDGKVATRKVIRGEILTTESIDESELKAGYYKLIRSSIVDSSGAKITRQRSDAAPNKKENNIQNQELSDLIDNMKKMVTMASNILEKNMSVENHDEKEVDEIIVPVEAEVIEHISENPSLIFDQNDKISEDFMIDEDEAENDDDIYDENDYKNGNQAYANMLHNTISHQMGVGMKDSQGRAIREVRSCGNIAAKKMPTISEAKAGKYRPAPVIYDGNGKIANAEKRNEPINLVKNEKGDVDVVKSLGLVLTNRPEEESLI